MKIFNNIDDFKAKNPVVTVGTFDGVHLGHQKIFNHVKSLADKLGGESVVFTFWPHPRMVLDPKADKVSMINSIEEKIELIEYQGIDNLIIIPFTKEFSELSYCDFIEKFLHQKIKMKGLIVGYDHKFGHDREGNFDKLKNCTDKYNSKIEKVEALSVEGVNISSTIVRKKILDGNIETANKYLSRIFSIKGKVVEGKKIGRNLGFPTANIKIQESYKIIPKNGVYAVDVEYENKKYYGMLNIGFRPTLNEENQTQSIETHIFSFYHNIYDSCLKINFHRRIRAEMKFKNIEELKTQLFNDKIKVEQYFKIKENTLK
ncbi:MAG: bifunctional riboflavin kinase/FAD synthetase [Bacteroidales bacterium]|nr:bifunctional riboflavin kinase/FAD synthetase [Bacteroidales bacterium]MBN2757006.1 bifunctional riboflavin kinase/FAD synthetase [Bacteroidales bacterium]